MLLEEKADACWGKVLEEQRMGPQGRAYGFSKWWLNVVLRELLLFSQ